MKQIQWIAFAISILLSTHAIAEESSDWFRHASISPSGKFIVFSYHGDIYIVPVDGGLARAITTNEAWDGYPIWSRDGKHIAFASDRHGNLDVYIMSSEGGKATRLTFHSSNDIPSDFNVNNKAVLFSAARTETANSSFFPTSRIAELYEVSTDGGTPRMVSTIASSQARYSADGKKILYRDEKAYENQFRKHDVSAFARDIWLHDLESGQHTRMTDFTGGDHNPVWHGNEKVFYLSEDKSNNFNVWQMDTDGKNRKQISTFETHPVRHLSVSGDSLLCYTQHGALFTQRVGDDPKSVAVTFQSDSQTNDYQTKPLTSISEFSVSPNGKELAIVSRGEVFVTSRDFKTTVRVTNTPERERSVSFHKDGKRLLYASERGGKWKLYESSIADEREKYFFSATKIEEQEIYAAETESFQPRYSPDGEKIAFLAGRDEIQILNRKTGDTNVALGKEHNYSYSDGDITFDWSADSKWLIADYAPRGRLFIPNIGIFPADGSKQPIDISHSGYTDGSPVWCRGGDAVIWASARYGQRDHGSWGREFDVMAAFLNQDAYDKFSMSKEEYELAQELKDANKKDANKKDANKKEGDEKKDEEEKVNDVEIEWEAMDDRTVRLTKNSSNITQMYLVKDSSKLYYLKSDANGSELWERDFREDGTKLVKKFGPGEASFEFSSDEETVFFLSGGSLSHAKTDALDSAEPIAFEAVMELKPETERAYMFEHGWRQIKDKFYKPDFHGIDWDAMKDAYQAKLPSIANNRDLANLMAEMTGELNASHIGVSYRPEQTKSGDRTASLGVIFDMTDTSGPLTIAEVLDKSPLKKAKSSITVGMKLAAVDAVKLDGKANLAKLLNHKAGKRVRLSILREDGTRFDEVMIPISTGAESQLMYERWVKSRRELVEKLSAGRLGYVHVRGMNDSSFRVVYSEILGRNFDKEAIVVDTRWNGGGWLHNDLAKLLSGKEYVTMHVRGRQYHGDSLDQWNKPSILVMGEGNYSDAHAFPYTFDVLDIGEMVGMPVPGTMTAVWWETSLSGDIRVGVPQVGMKNKQGEYLENNQTEPDYVVKNDPESSAKGQDKQIEKAVEVLLKSLPKSNK